MSQRATAFFLLLIVPEACTCMALGHSGAEALLSNHDN